MGLVAELRAETAGLHRALHATPFVQALQAQRLLRAPYRRLLETLHPLHHAVEAALTPMALPLPASAWRFSPGLAADIAFFEGSIRSQPMEQTPDPGAALGQIYVLAGSRMGASTLRGSVARSLALDPDGPGLDYYHEPELPLEPWWNGMRRRLEDWTCDAAARRQAVAGAKDLMQRLLICHQGYGHD